MITVRSRTSLVDSSEHASEADTSLGDTSSAPDIELLRPVCACAASARRAGVTRRADCRAPVLLALARADFRAAAGAPPSACGCAAQARVQFHRAD